MPPPPPNKAYLQIQSINQSGKQELHLAQEHLWGRPPESSWCPTQLADAIRVQIQTNLDSRINFWASPELESNENSFHLWIKLALSPSGQTRTRKRCPGSNHLWQPQGRSKATRPADQTGQGWCDLRICLTASPQQNCVNPRHPSRPSEHPSTKYNKQTGWNHTQRQANARPKLEVAVRNVSKQQGGKRQIDALLIRKSHKMSHKLGSCHAQKISKQKNPCNKTQHQSGLRTNKTEQCVVSCL